MFKPIPPPPDRVAEAAAKAKRETLAVEGLRGLLAESGLYTKCQFTSREISAVAQELANRLPIDLYCVGCKKPSTFQRREGERIWSVLAGVSSTSDLPEQFAALVSAPHEYVCARNANHHARFLLNVDCVEPTSQHGAWLIVCRKVGQWPSFYEARKSEHDAYAGTVSDATLIDLKLADLSFSHGHGAGALIYLRRILDRLVEDEIVASIQDEIERDAIRRAPFTDRVKVLAKKVPFIISNKRVYAVLSEGVHAASEPECVAVYPVLKDAVGTILDQRIASDLREEREKRVARELANLDLPKA